VSENETIYGDVLRDHITDFDTEHLKKLAVMFYDRWAWETGHPTDRKLIDTIDEELRNRGDTSPVISNGATGELMFTAEKITICHPLNGLNQELFSTEFGELEIGDAAKRAMIRAIMTDLGLEHSGVFHNGKTLKQLITYIVNQALSVNMEHRISNLELKVDGLEKKNENRD